MLLVCTNICLALDAPYYVDKMLLGFSLCTMKLFID